MAIRNQALLTGLTVTQAVANATVQSQLDTGLEPSVNPNAWEINRLELYMSTEWLKDAATDAYARVQIVRKDPELAFQSLLNTDAIAEWRMGKDSQGSVASDMPIIWEPPEDRRVIVVERNLFILLASDGVPAGVTLNATCRLYYEETRVAQLDALSMLRC